MSEPSNSATVEDEWSFCFASLGEAESCAFAADLAHIVAKGDCIALDGNLGLGKSTFARALLRERGGDPHLEVPSPTFTLVQGYEFSQGAETLEISHFDLYRISDFEELYEIGLEESWQTGCAMIEWPDRAEELLPDDTLWLHFQLSDIDDTRRLTLSGSACWAERLQRLCEKRALLNAAGWGDARIHPIKGDLSPRRYDRVLKPGISDAKGSATAILMDMPPRDPGPILADGRAYDLVAHRVTRLAPMVSIRQGLDGLGLRVPEPFGVSLDEGLVLWEDFGTETLAEGPETPIAERYVAVVEALAHLHNQPCPRQFDGAGGIHTLSDYDRDAFAVELDVFLDHYWPHGTGGPALEADREAFHTIWAPLIDHLTASEQALVLRDVQDPNCFWLEEEGSSGSVGFIDFQDCMVGPSAYDLSALAMDARVTISDELENQMRVRYKHIRGLAAKHEAQFDAAYAICAAQRTLKNLGAFARAAHQMNRPHYLDHIPRSLRYLAKAMRHPLLLAFKDWYESKGLII